MARSNSFGRDTGLQARMLLTIFLLGLVYAILVAALIAAGAGAVTIAIVAAGLFALQLFTSDKIALYSMGARVVGPNDGPEARTLHAIIERLCIQANLPKPRVAIAETPMPNAFAIGRSPKSATVCATTGILRLLDPAELEAVLGHELTHVQNRDVVVMTVASFFASIAAFITQWGFFFGGGFGGDNRDNNNNGFFVVILVSAAVYVVSFLLLQALSRYREFAADRGSAIITGRPSALISALMKIDGGMNRIPQRDLRAAPGELAAFYIFPPKAKQTVATLFSTHPSLEARIARLQRLEAQLQGTA
ncbi:MAG: zinc metalloprotease HtpX [Solirubrobacterales bacterium]|nr:zinc metalloprotease HtpX [Solirubrobacterales bacterium]MBV9942007.1 zinc metalloprotease HtpX [Solirubrobacterales bacterium]